MLKFEYSPDYNFSNSNNFNYAYSSSSSFADITGAGGSATAIIITERRVSDNYEMIFEAKATASGARSITIASSEDIRANKQIYEQKHLSQLQLI